MTPTLRRLDDRERYFGLTWPAWLGTGFAGGVLYLAVRLSPFGARTTVTIVALGLALAGVVLAAVSGQALSPGRQLAAIVRYRITPRHHRLSERPDRSGLVLDRAPVLEWPDSEVAGIAPEQPR